MPAALERTTAAPERTWPSSPWVGVAGWTLVVAAGVVWGTFWIADAGQSLRAAPFSGHWRVAVDVRSVPAVVGGVAVVVYGPRLAQRLAWRSLVLVTGAGASAWALLLAASDGWRTPFNGRHEYMGLAGTIESPLEFLRTFAERAPSYPVHVKGHPPGATLAFWMLDVIGLRGAGWAGLVVAVAWGVAVAAALVALTDVAGASRARVGAPFLVLCPAAVWAAFSADALFAASGAVGVALVVVASGAREGRATALAISGGAVLGLTLHLTYGAVPLLLVPAAVAVARHRTDVLVPAAVGAAAVTGAFVAAGFWWFDGLAVTHQAYWDGVASRRPWPFYLLTGNPAVLALATGPVVAVALGCWRRAGVDAWLVPAAALAAVAAANLSGLSKGEVERIWLPFVPWILTAAAAVPFCRARRWLGAQAAIGIAVQALLRSPW